MISRIARKEWLDMIRDGRFRVAAAVIALLLLASLFLGASQQRALRAEREISQRVSRQQWLNQADKDPHQATHFGQYIVKPPSALGLFDPGVSDYTGSAILIESHHQSDATLQAARDEGLAGRFGQLAAASVLQLLLPLLIILLGFGAFAQERESGTLRQVLALGVSRHDLACGKALGITAALGVLLVPTTLAAIATMLFSAGGVSTWGVRATLLLVTYALYFGIFIALTLAVSARAQTSRGALVGLLGFWVFATLFAPRLASDAVRALYPTPSALQFASWIEDAKKAEEGTEKPIARIKALQAKLMKQYGVSKLADLPIYFRGVMLQQAEDRTSRAFDSVYARLWGTFDKQNSVYTAASFVAPTLGVRSISMAMAGTDWQAHKSFAQSVEAYRRDWVRRLNDDLTQHPPRPGEEYKASRALWQSIPDYKYLPPTTSEILGAQKANLAALTLWLIASIGAMLWSVGRMKAQ